MDIKMIDDYAQAMEFYDQTAKETPALIFLEKLVDTIFSLAIWDRGGTE